MGLARLIPEVLGLIHEAYIYYYYILPASDQATIPACTGFRMTSAVFAGFPTESLQWIFSYFCLHCRGSCSGTQQRPDKSSWYTLERHALFSLCLASRRFCDIAQPVLYDVFVLDTATHGAQLSTHGMADWLHSCGPWKGDETLPHL